MKSVKLWIPFVCFCYNSFVAATAATIDDNVVVFVVFVIVDVVFFCGNQWKQSKEREQIINTSKARVFGVSILMDSKRALEREGEEAMRRICL